MRVVLSTYGSRGDVQPLIALAVALQALGAEVRVCAPPDDDSIELADRAGVPLVPAGQSVREMLRQLRLEAAPPDLPRRAAMLFASQYEAVASAAAEGCDAIVGSGVTPAAAAAGSVAEKLGVRYVYEVACPIWLPSPHHRPLGLPGVPFPPDVTDNQILWELDAQNMNTVFAESINTNRASIGLPPLQSVRDFIFTDRPWLAADPHLAPWPQPSGLEVEQTGAWILPDERPLPTHLEAFLETGTPPVYVGFGSIPMLASTEIARAAIEAIRAHGRRAILARGWADMAVPNAGEDCFTVGEVNQQKLFRRVAAVIHHGGAGTTTAAALAGAPQIVVPQIGDQPYWAARAAKLGIGAAHEGPTLTFDSLSAALATALAPETQARATDTAHKVRKDGAHKAARLLLNS